MHLNEINSKKKFDFSCIYLWTNTVNGKHYVGQAHNFYDRMSQYKKGFFNRYMKSAIEKYGIDAFDISILECNVPNEKLDNREQYWMDYYQSYKQDKGYNICEVAGTTFGFKHSQETKEALSKKRKAQFQNSEFKKKFQGENNGMYGKKHDEEWRKNHSDRLKNKWQTDEEYREFWHNKMSGENNYFFGKHLFGEANGMYGKHHSEESKEKMRKANSISVMCVETNVIYSSIKDAAEAISGSAQEISKVTLGKKETYKGYHWVRI